MKESSSEKAPEQAMEAVGDITTSIFSQTEQLLRRRECQRCLADLERETGETQVKYRSMIDFLLCCVYPQYKGDCMDFCNEESGARPLRETIPQEDLRAVDDVLSAKLVGMLEGRKRREDEISLRKIGL